MAGLQLAYASPDPVDNTNRLVSHRLSSQARRYGGRIQWRFVKDVHVTPAEGGKRGADDDLAVARDGHRGVGHCYLSLAYLDANDVSVIGHTETSSQSLGAIQG